MNSPNYSLQLTQEHSGLSLCEQHTDMKHLFVTDTTEHGAPLFSCHAGDALLVTSAERSQSQQLSVFGIDPM